MGKSGRKPLLVPTVLWSCRIPVDVAAKVDMHLLDPVRNTTAYGARSELVARLLRAWLATRELPGAVDKLTHSADNPILPKE